MIVFVAVGGIGVDVSVGTEVAVNVGTFERSNVSTEGEHAATQKINKKNILKCFMFISTK
jgi:hypothetical protein